MVLLWSATAKAAQPTDTLAVFTYIFSDSLAWPCTTSLIAFELLLGSCLVTGVAWRIIVPTTSVLLLGFSGWITWLWLSGQQLGCGCGAIAGHEGYSAIDRMLSLSRVVVMFSACVLWMTASAAPASIDRTSARLARESSR
jgi:hypothetical protein